MIVDLIYGFLGSGKTTVISRFLQRWGAEERIVVLVNEFGDVGIDGEVLAARGGNVLEMPSGCICCSLKADFRTQLLDIVQDFRPQRLVVEPTGVATITQIRSIVEAEIFEQTISRINNIMVLDASGFLDFYKANRHFVESQAQSAHLVLLNKCDKVDGRRARLVRDAVSAIQPDAPVLMTEFGSVDWAEYRAALASGRSATAACPAGTEVNGAGDSPPDGLGYESAGWLFPNDSFDARALECLFRCMTESEGAFGGVIRAKGIFRIGDRWLLLELASGEVSHQYVRSASQSKVSVIGRDLEQALLEAGFRDCIAQ